MHSFYIVFITYFCPRSARRHGCQIKPPATGHRHKENLENDGQLRQVIGRALWCVKNTSTDESPNLRKKCLESPEMYLWQEHWVGKPFKPMPLLAFQHVLGNIESNRIESQGKKWIEHALERPQTCTDLVSSVIWCHLGAELWSPQVRILEPTIQLVDEEKGWKRHHYSSLKFVMDVITWLSSWSCHWVEEAWWNWTLAMFEILKPPRTVMITVVQHSQQVMTRLTPWWSVPRILWTAMR